MSPPAGIPESAAPVVLYSVGHSTHPIERFLELLSGHHIALVADVRSFPSSRRWPQFNQPDLERALSRAGLSYRWFTALGGRRHRLRPNSPHVAWTSEAFRSYADHADTGEFAGALAELVEAAAGAATAYMCAEGLWWRCHRRIISDRLVLLGHEVMHILPDGKLARHRLPEFARVVEGRLVYSGS